MLERMLHPWRALLHPLWLAAVATLALNDHVFKGAGWLPAVVTGKLSDVAGLLAAPALLAVLGRVRSERGLLLAHAATGAVFAAIKLSAAASGWFVAALAAAGLTWRNWVDPTDLLALPALLASWFLLRPAMRQARAAGWAERGAVVLGVPVMLASGDANMGGANKGSQAPGSGDGGVKLSLGEIAVDPQGSYFLSTSDSKLLLADIETRSVEVLAGLPVPQTAAFWPASRGRGFFLTTTVADATQAFSYDVAARKTRWIADLSKLSKEVVFFSSTTKIEASEAHDRVFFWNENGLVALDTTSGDLVGSFTTPQLMADVDLLGDRLIVTSRHEPAADKLPRSIIHVRSQQDLAARCEIVVPNCHAELVLAADGKRAFLAPTFCGRDPVSVIDLETCAFEKNLPGFGPVALSENGRTAVAFLDRDNDDPLAPPIPEEVKMSDQRYHLMFIDTTTLAFGTTPVGAELPRYAVTPDGQLLLVDALTQATKDNVRIVDVASRSIRTVTGPSIQLEHYALLPDSSAAFAIHKDALYLLDLVAAQTSLLALPYTPTALNMTPTGGRLLLRDPQHTVHLFDVARRTDIGEFVPPTVPPTTHP